MIAGLAALALLLCYASTLRGMSHQWWNDEDMSHGFAGRLWWSPGPYGESAHGGTTSPYRRPGGDPFPGRSRGMHGDFDPLAWGSSPAP